MLVISSLSQALAPYLFGSVIDLSVKNVTLWYVYISVLDTIILLLVPLFSAEIDSGRSNASSAEGHCDIC